MTISAVRLLAVSLGALALGACENQDPAPKEFNGSTPQGTATPAPEPQATLIPTSPAADARGVIVYPDYAVIQARPGDTIDAMAARVSVAPSELAAYNGLPAAYVPRSGDELVLPPRPGGYGPVATGGAQVATLGEASGPISEGPTARQEGWSPDQIGAAIEGGAEPVAPAEATPQTGAPVPATLGQTGVQHVVTSGETVASIAQLYGATVGGIVTWNALRSADQPLEPGQLLLVPTGASASAPRGQVAGDGLLAPPPSANDVLPKDTTPPPTLASPNLGQYQTEAPAPAPKPEAPTPAPVEIAETPAPVPAATETATTETAATRKLLRPVQGRVIKPFSRGGSAERNDGVDLEAPAGAPVLAADDGEVALVSRSLGGLGNIILLRHGGQILTVYGRLDGVEVAKGQRVSRGQVIGTVARAPSGPSNLHFEVRQGAASVDPAPYL